MPQSTLTARAPGRVNLIGEHTDYTGGLVLPIAISFETLATLAPTTGDVYRFTSHRFAGTRETTAADTSPATGHWSDYAVGVLREILALGITVPAFTLDITGNVPLGAGLSSSASLEVASAVALLAHAKQTLPVADLALLCQRAENLYVGSPCGIMDQFAVTAARRGHALLLHTRDLQFEQLPLDTGSLVATRFVVTNSMVRHSVAAGVYGDRRREVESGQAAVLAQFPTLRDLGDATLPQLEAAREAMTPESFARCRHILTENARVLLARKAMLAGDAPALGVAMTASHISQRDDFRCSTPEIDFLVDTAIAQPGCFGSRLTGGGFGGCTVSLVEATQAETFATAVRNAYQQHFQLAAETFVCEPADGALHNSLSS